MKYIYFIIFILAGLFIWYGYHESNSLRNNQILTIGTIEYFQGGGRANAGRTFINGTFSINGIRRNVSSVFLKSQIVVPNPEEYFVGKKFPVIYEKGNPNNCMFLITPEDFAIYNRPFPDSLRWVLKYLKN